MILYAEKVFIPLNLLFFSGSFTWIWYGLAGGSHIGSISGDTYSEHIKICVLFHIHSAVGVSACKAHEHVHVCVIYVRDSQTVVLHNILNCMPGPLLKTFNSP